LKPLDREAILAELSPAMAQSLGALTVLESVGSTNTVLSDLPAAQLHAHVVVADEQTDGRGRRRRHWHSPPGGNIYFSLGWRFEDAVPSPLPLVAAVGLCRALDAIGLSAHGIKWPNDVQVGERKLAGILVESQSGVGGPPCAVIGIGLNVCMPREGAGTIDRPWTDLREHMGDSTPERNRIVAALVEQMMGVMTGFVGSGLRPFHADWSRRDLLAGRQVAVEGVGEVVRGRADGIDADGALRIIPAGGGSLIINSGEVSVRYG
jgi:BirA family biotin operon repressor/biotin-[acetyl-CoA-carboxylase] ligase